MIFILVFPELQQLVCHKVYEHCLKCLWLLILQCTLHIVYLWNFNLHRSTHGAPLLLSYTFLLYGKPLYTICQNKYCY